MGKNVAVFVDVANIFYAAKAAGTDIDYVTLLKATTAGRDFVRAYAYTGLDPDNENQRNFHAFLARNHYKVVSKDIRKYGDGKVKANLDIELVVDLMKTARNLDIAIVISGDGDFAPAIRAVQEMGVRVEVVSFRGNTSSDLIEVADLFTDITQLARVDKTSSRSGRRVAGDDEDLSMTEVPDKQTEGTGQRSRGRGRGRGRPGEAEPVAARARTGGRSTTSRSASPAEPVTASAPAGNGSMTVLPGEKLSRVAPGASAPAPLVDLEDEDLTPFDIDPESMPGGVAEGPADGDADGEGDGEGDARRRRRRRGGRGRGRGRGRDGEALPADEATAPASAAALDDAAEDEDEDEDVAPAPRGPRTTPFGSVWDSQLGTPTSAPASLGPVTDDEDFDEPEIPEYLIAEQRRGRQGQGQSQGGRGGQGGRSGGGGARGGRAAYNSAIERERYGRGGGGGINRYPDVSGRTGQGGRPAGQPGGSYARQDASYSRPQAERIDRPGPRSSSDPWSEVPPELEEQLRAQLAQSPKGRRPERPPAASRIEAADAAGEIETMTVAPLDEAAATPAPKRRTTSRRKTGPDGAVTANATAAPASELAAEAPKRRATRKKADDGSVTSTEAPPFAVADVVAEPAPKKRAASRRKTEPTADAGPGAGSADAGPPDVAPSAETAAPKKRATRKKADPA
ncbi:MAG: NYN domain-containing protein [Candidatus Limnocylindrales bacterium]